MNKLMRIAPTLLSAAFIFITLSRVSSFSVNVMNAGFLGYVFSIALGIAVYTSAYWMKVSSYKATDEGKKKVNQSVLLISVLALLFFVFIDGYFNLVDVLISIGETDDRMILFAAWLYGLFPTFAAALLGIMQGFVERTPHVDAPYDVVKLLRKTVYKKLDFLLNVNSMETPVKQLESEVKLVEISSPRTKVELIHMLHKEHPEFTHAKIAEEVGVSRVYVGQVLAKNGSR